MFLQRLNGVSHCMAGREEEAILKAVGLPSTVIGFLEFEDIPPGGEYIRRTIEDRSEIK